MVGGRRRTVERARGLNGCALAVDDATLEDVSNRILSLQPRSDFEFRVRAVRRQRRSSRPRQGRREESLLSASAQRPLFGAGHGEEEKVRVARLGTSNCWTSEEGAEEEEKGTFARSMKLAFFPISSILQRARSQVQKVTAGALKGFQYAFPLVVRVFCASFFGVQHFTDTSTPYLLQMKD